MRIPCLFVALTVAACGGDSSDAKNEVACGATWTTSPATPGTCDLACAEMTTGTGASCPTGIQTGLGEYMCPTTFEVDGDRGCCLDTGMVSQVVGVNEPERQRRVFFLSCTD